MFAKTFTLASLATFASAHMLMNNPVPYGKSNLNNAPLLADGSDFPCKQRQGTYDLQGASNVYAQGSTQQLSFTGQAVHGGGSCQISITTDENPDKNSVWKVIKSIEGGCPAKGQEGNMGDNADAEDPYKYSYTIPKELAAGKYTIAWTWFNKIGNREMYMNCAAITVKAGKGTPSTPMSKRPAMFVANVGNGCGTTEMTDLMFPNPGPDVSITSSNTKAPVGQCPAGPGAVIPTTTKPAVVPTTTKKTTTTKPSSTKAPVKTTTKPGGIFVTVPVSTTLKSTTRKTTTTAPPVPTSGVTGAITPGTACKPEGYWNCHKGGTSFQRCASGTWSVVMYVAPGTKCIPGQSMEFIITWA